jgi:hypothetical protein
LPRMVRPSLEGTRHRRDAAEGRGAAPPL